MAIKPQSIPKNSTPVSSGTNDSISSAKSDPKVDAVWNSQSQDQTAASAIKTTRSYKPVAVDSPAPSAPEKQAETFESTNEEEDFPEDYPDFYPSEMTEYLVEQEAINILKKREDTRGRLAIIYTIATFSMFVLGFVVAVLDAAWRGVTIAETLGAILPLISGIFLGTLGFVLGYYFRQAEDEERKR